jgi:hypothetical protein
MEALSSVNSGMDYGHCISASRSLFDSRLFSLSESHYPPCMVTQTKIFEMLGRLSALLSTLEADVQTLLCSLVSKEEFMMAATILEMSTFARTLDLLDKASHFQDSVLEGKIQRLLVVVKPLRRKRNLFVHGCWNLSPKLLDQGKVVVSESKVVRFDRGKNSKTWRRGIDHKFTYEELQTFQTEVTRSLKMAKELLSALRGCPVAAEWSPRDFC